MRCHSAISFSAPYHGKTTKQSAPFLFSPFWLMWVLARTPKRRRWIMSTPSVSLPPPPSFLTRPGCRVHKLETSPKSPTGTRNSCFPPASPPPPLPFPPAEARVQGRAIPSPWQSRAASHGLFSSFPLSPLPFARLRVRRGRRLFTRGRGTPAATIPPLFFFLFPLIFSPFPNA